MGSIGKVLYQQARRPFWQRHPVVAACAVAATAWLLLNGAHVLVAVIGIAWLALAIRRRRRAIALRDAGLRARAEYEHLLSLRGDPRGIYGRYPPVQQGWYPDPRNRCRLRYFDGAMWTGYTASAGQ